MCRVGDLGVACAAALGVGRGAAVDGLVDLHHAAIAAHRRHSEPERMASRMRWLMNHAVLRVSPKVR